MHPPFLGRSFWNYQETLKAVGRRYSNTPLGLATVAALLPERFEVRLIDCNVEELTDADLGWADVVGTGGMLSQQRGARQVIARAKRLGCFVVAGGPDVSTSPDIYADADVRVIGEAEAVQQELIEAIDQRKSGAILRAAAFPDITRSPIPRFDLLRVERYLHVGVQVTRGCPHRCEFCSVIELNGRRPRSKTPAQVLAELEALYQMGYRGHVDFVDDNFIGDRRTAKALLKALLPWLEERGQPFEFSSEVSLDLGADDELLDLMRRANFFAVFVGVETPDPEALRASNKQQNLRQDIVQSLVKIQRAGIFINGGFIVGFDAEHENVADRMVGCIEDSAVTVCMVGLLYALPGTQLAQRLAEEGRLEGLFDDTALGSEDDADQCTSGLNFRTLRPKSDTLMDYRDVIRRIYEPGAYFGRVRRLVRMLDRKGSRFRPRPRQIRADLASFLRISLAAGWRNTATRRDYWYSLLDALVHNPRGAKAAVSMAALYLHLGPFAEHVESLVEQRLSALASEAPRSGHVREPAPSPQVVGA